MIVSLVAISYVEENLDLISVIEYKCSFYYLEKQKTNY